MAHPLKLVFWYSDGHYVDLKKYSKIESFEIGDGPFVYLLLFVFVNFGSSISTFLCSEDIACYWCMVRWEMMVGCVLWHNIICWLINAKSC